MSKTPFSKEKALKSATVSNQIEGYAPVKDKEVLNYIDVLVDGRYVDELHDFRLKWCGSSNQRVIDVKKSLKKGDVVLLDERKLVGA